MIDTHSKVSNKSFEKCHDWESAIWLPSSEFLWNSLYRDENFFPSDYSIFEITKWTKSQKI